MTRRITFLTITTLSFGLAACTSDSGFLHYNTPSTSFAPVSQAIKKAGNQGSVWVQNREQAEMIANQVHKLIHKKTISANKAVQVALMNNKGLQATYAGIGLSGADVWQESRPERPKASLGVFGISAPGLGAYRSIEGLVVGNILRLLTRDKRLSMADIRFKQAQKQAVLETLRLAHETRLAWINAVAAFEKTSHLKQAQIAANAASELAQRLGETGAITQGAQAREHAFFAELSGQIAEAKLEAKLAKGNLSRLMGLWGNQTLYYVPDDLPELPQKATIRSKIEKEALQNRIDLAIAKLELEALAKRYDLTQAKRYVSDLELIAGFESEREIETEDGVSNRETVTTPQIELEFEIPIFDSGQAKLRKAELAYMRQANRLAEMAVNARSEAQAAYLNYRSSFDIAHHYHRNVVPIRAKIEEEALLTYNGMITNTFELLQDTRGKINAILQAGEAKRKFWVANSGLKAVIYSAVSGDTSGTDVAVDNDGDGGH